ncbi:hypothetical protein TNCV_4606951 [Trichonephila clavipes]|nr:hypothetical protein TNCV_4606951 [Trichonephila clavipes]
MLNDDEIVTSVQAESDSVDDETDEEEDNNNGSSKGSSAHRSFSRRGETNRSGNESETAYRLQNSLEDFNRARKAARYHLIHGPEVGTIDLKE